MDLGEGESEFDVSHRREPFLKSKQTGNIEDLE